MKIYTTTDARGHYPIGTAIVIVANDKGHAMRLLIAKCKEDGIPQHEDDLQNIELTIIDPDVAGATILLNGNY